MSSPAPAKQDKLATKPHQKMQGHTRAICSVLRLSEKRRIITSSWDGSLRVWDMESGKQVGYSWKDEGSEAVFAMALSPDGKTVTSGSGDGAVRLWDIDTGKVVKKWTGHTETVGCICWSPDGGRVVSGCDDGTVRVWDVESGKTIIGPIKAGDDTWVYAVCYSPDGTMIATGTDKLKVWDTNTGELLKTLEVLSLCLAWTSDGKTLIAGSRSIKKFDTATWTETAVLDRHIESVVYNISLSPNERILASASWDKKAQLWNLDNNQLIEPLIHHEDNVNCVAFSADGKILVTGCDDKHVFTWDVFAIVKEAGLDDLLSDNVNTVKKPFNIDADATRPQPSKIEGARPSRPPPGFFDDLSTSRGRRDHRATAPHLLGCLPSFWRRPSDPRRGPVCDTQFRSHPCSSAKNLFSGMLSRQDGLDIQLRELPVVEVPWTWVKPRNYHARGKTATSSSRPRNMYVMRQPSRATHSTPPLSQQVTTSTALRAVVTTATATGISSHLDITITHAGYWMRRFLLWIGCISIQYTDNQH